MWRLPSEISNCLHATCTGMCTSSGCLGGGAWAHSKGVRPADGIPIAVRLLNNKRFEPGPFYLGKAGIIIGWIAVAWIITITVRACGVRVVPPLLLQTGEAWVQCMCNLGIVHVQSCLPMPERVSCVCVSKVGMQAARGIMPMRYTCLRCKVMLV